ncbi:hypothetical protein E1263_26215 [Kribbella antibiotica]|uniref:Uncharacterized protein n=1 Tax=Kribbella antibiotica TaxID=190195 RepID=A0A4R4ZDA4_9ACTN|nr:hypothetical protein [Kribbella antibiotica]TDD55444.1 hypothetical protein E1263_26215 [Kribbella antibiotica]
MRLASSPVKDSSVPTDIPASGDVQIRVGGRWVAGHELGRRADEVLVSHHGHLVWVDRAAVRKPL